MARHTRTLDKEKYSSEFNKRYRNEQNSESSLNSIDEHGLKLEINVSQALGNKTIFKTHGFQHFDNKTHSINSSVCVYFCEKNKVENKTFSKNSYLLKSNKPLKLNSFNDMSHHVCCKDGNVSCNYCKYTSKRVITHQEQSNNKNKDRKNQTNIKAGSTSNIGNSQKVALAFKAKQGNHKYLDLRDALQVSQRAMKMAPGNLEAMVCLAEVLIMMGKNLLSVNFI